MLWLFVFVLAWIPFVRGDGQQPIMNSVPHRVPTIYNGSSVDPQQSCPGYMATSVKEIPGIGFSATLELNGPACNAYGTDIDKLSLTVEYQNVRRIAISITPKRLTRENESYYDLPEDAVLKGYMEPEGGKENSEFVVDWSNDPSFWFNVRRKDNGDVLFSTQGFKLVFENQFFEFKTHLPSGHHVFGLGENLGDFRIKPDTVRTLYNADVPDLVGGNLYGTHPMYLEQRFGTPAQSHGVYLRNAHAQEVLVGATYLTWRGLGGSIELYVFAGPQPRDVIQQYEEVIGYPGLQPYWSLGFHQCRWGYSSVDDLKTVARKYRESDIPLETLWSDIDYMDRRRDFTYDKEKYPLADFRSFVDDLHAKGQHYVPIVDAAIYAPQSEDEDYPPFRRGIHSDVFVKNPDGSPFVGKVWPGPAVFPDFLAFNTPGWWLGELHRFHSDIRYDGIWLDMNEVSSFCTGRDCGISDAVVEDSAPNGVFSNGTIARVPHPNARNLDHPPYVINNTVAPGELGSRTMPPSSIHAGGIAEYDWHNLYGFQEAKTTFVALSQEIHPGKRPFIISRSTFAGSGKFTGHWGGDNWSSWDYLRYSITQGLSFSMFGMPFFGTDTCGFKGDADEELCNRWAQLNAFFSFYRNHNDIGTASQEFYEWPSVAEAAQKAMEIRYWLLPYLYTLLYNSHEHGDTFLRALSWDFPDEERLSGMETQFMVGPALMVAPVLTPGATSVDVTFPYAEWYDWYTQMNVNATDEVQTFDAPLGHIPLFIRGGSVLALQEPGYTVAESRNGAWELLVALDEEGDASGDLYIDDGESMNPFSYSYTAFYVCHGGVHSDFRGSLTNINELKAITILGMPSKPKELRFNEEVLPDSMYKYNDTSSVLNVKFTDHRTQGKNWLDNLELEWTL
uniref:Maltase n=1 Tax=Blastobotrys adeninivorans TaxID=409370 RepID=A0A060T6J9_BLAAD